MGKNEATIRPIPPMQNQKVGQPFDCKIHIWKEGSKFSPRERESWTEQYLEGRLGDQSNRSIGELTSEGSGLRLRLNSVVDIDW